MSALPDLAAAPVAFALGCLLIHAARAHARTITVLLSAAALMLCANVGGVLCDRLGLPSGSAEAGVLFWPHPDP